MINNTTRRTFAGSRPITTRTAPSICLAFWATKRSPGSSPSSTEPSRR